VPINPAISSWNNEKRRGGSATRFPGGRKNVKTH
jgi:hypothetical protein